MSEVFEWDGDGRDDILVILNGTWQVLRSNGAGFDAPINTGIAADSAKTRLFDLSGDGRHDLVRVTTSGGLLRVYVRLRTASGFAATEALAYQGDTGSGMVITSASWPADRNWRMRSHRKRWDYNGDGREGFVLFLTHSDPEQVSPPYQTWTAFTSLSTPSAASVGPIGSIGGPAVPGYQLEPLPVDLNGDGLTDLVYAHGNSYRVRFSRGISLSSEVTGPSVAGLSPSISVVTDYDGDGVSDIVVRNTSTNRWSVIRGTGIGFSTVGDTGLSAADAYAPRVGDIDGNGLPDLLWTNFTTGAWHFRRRSGLYPDLLTQATDGYGNTVAFQYESIARGNYTKHADAQFPEQDYAGPMQVVASQTESNGIGATFITSFWYHGARRHLEGRGFEGFHAVRSQDSRNGLYAWAYFQRTFPFTGMQFQSDLFQPNGTTLIAREQHTLAAHSYGSGFQTRRLPYISQSVSSRYEVGGSYNSALVSTTTAANTVNSATGTLTDSTTTVTEPSTANGVQAGASYVRRTWHSSLHTDLTNWCIGRPATTQSIHSHNKFGGGQLTRQQTVTWDSLYCRPTQAVEQPGDAQWQVTTAFGYDAFGNMNSQTVTGTGMTGRTTGVNWGATGQFPISVTNALSQTTQLGWNVAKGLQTSQTDPNGIAVSWQHDSFGRQTLESRPDGTATSLSYNDCAGSGCVSSLNKLLITETELAVGGGTVRDTRHYLDRFDRVIVTRAKTLSGAYNHLERQYDALGRIQRDSAPCWWGACSLYWTTYSYDLVDRPIQVSRPLSASNPTLQTTNTYYEGLTTRTVDPLSKQSIRIANVLGDLARTSDHGGHAKTFDYNPFGDPVRVTDNAGNTLQTNTFNIRGMLTTQSDMDRGGWTFQPNALGELRYIRDAKTAAPNWTTILNYDALGRMTSRQDVPEGVTSTWTWGTSAAAKNIGRLASLAGSGYSESYTYDSIGRPATTSITSDATYQFAYAYNSVGALHTLTYPTSTSGYRLKLQYDYQNGYPLRVKDFNTPSTVFWQANATDARGRFIDENLGSALQRIRGFDPVTGRVEYIQTGPGGSASVQNLTYTWDGAGNLTQRRDDNQSLTEAFVYDNLHRLTSSTRNGVNNLTVAYNALGNITSKSGVGSYTYHATRKHAVVSTSGGGSYVYDANGNMSSRNGSTISWYSYDLPNTVNAGSAYSQFFYTPDRARYKQVANYSGTLETTIYIGGLLEKMTRGALTEYRHTIPAGEEHTVLYTRRSNGTIDTYHVTRDHLGSASAITNSAGTVLVNESFTAFGERRGANWSGTPSSGDLTQIAATTRRGFTDHEHLDNLSLIHMNGRVYDSALGRFISADPYIDGWTHTQGYNRYSYVKNNPLRAIDPTGFKGKNDESDESEGPGGPVDNITVYGQQSSGNGTGNLLLAQMTFGTDADGRSTISIYNPETGDYQTVTVNAGEGPLAGGLGAVRALSARYAPKVSKALKDLFGKPHPTKLNRHGKQQPFDATNGRYLGNSANPGFRNSVGGRALSGFGQGFAEGASGVAGAAPVGTAGAIGYDVGYVIGVIFGLGK